MELAVDTGEIMASIPLPNHAESFAVDTDRIFVNIPDHNSTIAVVNRSQGRVSDLWHIVDP